MTEPNATEPIPKRWWWTKRLLPVAVLFLAAAIGSRAWWGYHAGAKLDALREEIRARGEPLAWAELEPPPVPAEQNAVVLLEELTMSPERWQNLDRAEERLLDRVREGTDHRSPGLDLLWRRRDLRVRFAEDIQRFLREAKGPVRVVRRACRRPEARWKIDFDQPAYKLRLPHFSRFRDLAHTLVLAAVVAHEQGDDDKAVAYLRHVLGLASSQRAHPDLVAHLVSHAISSIAAEGVEGISADLRVGSSPGDGRRKAVKRLTAELLDADPLRRGPVRAFISERCSLYDIFERLRAWPHLKWWSMEAFREGAWYWRVVARYFSGPMHVLDEAFMLRRMTRAVEAAKSPGFPAAASEMPEPWAHPEGLRRCTRMLSSNFLASLDGCLALSHRVIAVRQMAGLALAIRLYEIDHGRRPGELSDLVPQYVDELSCDPFAADSSTYGYLPGAGKPILYSIGEDEEDNREDYLAGRYFLGNEERGAVHFLNGDRPMEPDEGAGYTPSGAENEAPSSTGATSGPWPPGRERRRDRSPSPVASEDD